MIVVFDHPVNGIARQSILARERGNTTVFHVTQSALGCRPERTILIELKALDTASAQSIGVSVRCADLTVLEIRHATLKKSEPKAALQRIGAQRKSVVLTSQASPGYPFDHTFPKQMNKTLILVADPEIPCAVPSDGPHV